MTITIPEHTLRDVGLTECDAVIEFACRLFDAGRLDLWPAAQVAGLTRVEMEGELPKRGIAVFRPTLEDFGQALKSLEALRAAKDADRRQ